MVKVAAWVAVSLILGWFALFGSTTEVFHEKLTLTVSSPSGPRQASAVTSITTTRRYGLIPQMFKGMAGGATGGSFAVGAAVMLEVTPGRWLFVLQSDAWGTHRYSGLSQSTFHDPSKGIPLKAHFKGSIKSFLQESDPGTEVEVPRFRWPAFVTFDELADPSTLRLVDPDNLAATFGPGVTLVGLTLSQTDGPGDVTDLKTLLPWLCAAEVFPTFAEREKWTDLDRRHFSLRQPSQFLPSHCGPA